MTDMIWDKDESQKKFDAELEKARTYLYEKKKITPKPELYKKITTLPDKVERTIRSDIKVKEELIEILGSFKNKNEWSADISRLAKEAGGLRLVLEAHKIKE
jgi:hypothetical protein